MIFAYWAGLPVSWIMMAPSITPSTSGGGPNNPGLRLYKFETNTGQVRGCDSGMKYAYPFMIISLHSCNGLFVRRYANFKRMQKYTTYQYMCCVCCILHRFWITRSTILICPKQIQMAKQTGWSSIRYSSITSCRKYQRSLFTIWRTDLRNRTITLLSGTYAK